MKTNSIMKMSRNLRTTVVKHSPEILTGLGIAGLVSTVIFGIRATPKALELIEQEKEKKGEPLTTVETIKTTWRCYIPTVVTGSTAIACLLGASSVNIKRNAALATAYTLSETALHEYKDSVLETIGEKKEQLIRDNIAKDKLEKNPITNNEIFITGKGDTLCFDSLSGRYFKSDIDKLKKVVNELNKRMLTEMYIPLNDFYYEIGISSIGIGYDIGWCVERDLIDLSYSSQLAEDGTPCLVIDYTIKPRYDYQS